MLDRSKAMTVSIFLTGWFFIFPSAPTSAAEPAETADRLQKIERDIGELKTQLKDLDLKTRLEGIDKYLEQLSKDMPLHITQIQKNTSDINALKEEVSKLQKAVAELQKNPPRVSLSPPETPQTGSIQLLNAWMTPMSVVVDGVSYQLQPGESRMIPRAAGNFSYEVLGLQPRLTRTVAAGETFTIRIGPR